ncbi:hypothetical protein VTH06DRAFT_4318 [Thermothelomyces fergusii]
MPLPQPKTALNNACSVIFNNTLYTYSADAFQSLRLEPGAKWEVLPQGEKVTGGVCVGSTTGTASTSAFFVVGGISDTEGYHGLQKYTYATGQWESVKLSSKVTHQRVGHNAVYINSTDSILVYAGNQDGQSAPSSQTFTIGASAPYAVNSHPTGGPPALNPILLPWSASEAVLLGGSTWNTQVTLFNVADGTWKDSGASLAAPLPKDTSAIQAVVMTGDDGSKNLITFDLSVSPNAVTRTVLFTGPGQPVPEAVPTRRRLSRRKQREPSRKAVRADEPLTLNNWPPYNSTGAPRVTRNNFAFAQGPDGMVVIAGGAAGDDLLCMFNARENSWEDPESKLRKLKALESESSTTSSMSSSTSVETTTTAPTSTTLSSTSTSVSATVSSPAVATETQTEADPSSVSDGSDPHLNSILGGVLGGILGLAAVLALIYMCIRRRNNRRAQMEADHTRQLNGAPLDEKDDFGFAKETLAFGQGFRGHKQQGSTSSFSSMAILMGRAGQSKLAAGLGRKSSNESKRKSSDSIYSAFKNTISKPIPHPAPEAATVSPLQPQQHARDPKGVPSAANTAQPRPRARTTGGDEQETARRSSGWNRYWSDGSASNLLGFGSGNNNNNSSSSSNVIAASNSQRTTLHSVGSSNYSYPHRTTQDSETVPPLFPAATESRMSLSRVNAHSPTFAVYNETLNEGMSGQIETQRPISSVSDLSVSAYSSGIPESVRESWDPTTANKPWGADRSLNDSFTSTYPTPLAPASQGLKPPPQGLSRPAPQREQAPIRDDMSWLNLNSN